MIKADTMEHENVEKKAKFYMKEKTSLHINLHSGKWFNGKIVDMKDNYFVFDEERLGKTVVFFEEVFNLEPRRKKKDEAAYRANRAWRA